jgi:hypothetical protein
VPIPDSQESPLRNINEHWLCIFRKFECDIIREKWFLFANIGKFAPCSPVKKKLAFKKERLSLSSRAL